MGKFVINKWVKATAWVFAIMIVTLNVQLVIQQLGDWSKSGAVSPLILEGIIVPVIIAIGILLVYVTLRPFFYKTPDKPNNVPHGIASAIHDIDRINYNHIGVSLDFSKNDWESIRHGVMQGGKDARYTLIHVVETAGAKYHGTDVMDMETQSDADNLQTYADELRSLGYNAHARIGYGSTSTGIADVVKQEKVDFLVMGSHGHKFLKDLIFGTTVNEVRHKVKVPVLIVKPLPK
jgi:manganese transport protein